MATLMATTLEIESPVQTTQTKQTIASKHHELVRLALAQAKQRVEKHLHALLQARTKVPSSFSSSFICASCEPLRSAMHEGLLAGGKRVRPFLLFASNALAEAVSARTGSSRKMRANTRSDIVEDAAAALEMVHCYSLIHDDLPAMDNDLLRRGQPTLHVKVGYGQAILAGDALLTLAFEVLAQGDETTEARLRLSLCFELARAAGAQGMAGGQSWDLESEQHPEKHAVSQINALKTGALLRVACAMGARCGAGEGKDDATLRAALDLYAKDLGNAYQAIDDLRDEERDRKRQQANNAPRPLLSRAERGALREEAVSLCRRAEGSLADYLEAGGEAATLLCAFARFLPTRLPQETTETKTGTKT